MVERLMPKQLDLGHHAAFSVGQPIFHWNKWKEAGSPALSDRMVMGYRLPPWQRPFVWSTPQKVKLIESIWLGLSIGTYTFNRCYERPDLNDLLIDGQQRMKALEEYLTDAFPVFGYTFSQLGRTEQIGFEHRHFHCFITGSEDDAYLRGYYDTMNFGGTAHDETQRASRETIERTE